MDHVTAGESILTNPAITPPDSGTIPEQSAIKSPDDAFAAIMDTASARMAGLPPKQPEQAPAPQDTPSPTPQDQQTAPPESSAQTPPKAEETPAAAPHHEPEMVKIRVDGQEIEVPKDRLVSLAQQGVDYTRKTQALAEQRRKLEAWQAVINRVQTDPAFAAKFQGLFTEQQQAPAQQPAQETPPEDPVERFKWEIKREAVREAQEAILGQVKPVTEQQAAMQHAMRLQAVKADVMRDPAYPEAMQLVRNYVANQPAAFQQRIYQELDQNPQAFLEVYGNARNHLMAMKQAAQAQTPQATSQAPQHPAAEPTPAPQIERKVTPREAPKLESAGQGVPQPTESAARVQSLKELRKKVLSGNSRAQDIGDYLDLTGAIGRMR